MLSLLSSTIENSKMNKAQFLPLRNLKDMVFRFKQV